MSVKVKFRCPHCDAKLSAGGKLAGREAGCPGCAVPLVVPAVTALVPVRPQAATPRVVEARPVERRVVRPKCRPAELTPVELHLPGQLGGMKANVDRKTGNMMATTFLGGLLVAIGAVLFAAFGGKSKSA